MAFWKPDVESIFKKANAQKVAEEIMSVSDQPTREQIVEMARDKNKESHKLFEWNNKAAADKYRLIQAGKIVTALCIEYKGLNEIKNPDRNQVPLRLLYNIDNGTGYTPIIEIVKNEDNYRKLLDRAKDELKSFKMKYSMLNELGAVFSEIDKL